MVADMPWKDMTQGEHHRVALLSYHGKVVRGRDRLVKGTSEADR